LRRILSNLSLELCRPLVSLRAGFDLILGEVTEPLETDQRSNLSTMVSLCDELLGLTRSYLNFAGLLQGNRPLSWGAFTIGVLLREVESQFAPLADRKRIHWDAGSTHPEQTVVTDPTRCQQVVGNLITNALNYTPAGGSVTLRAGVDGPSWFVSIIDNGPGIPTEARERVFEPFYRLPRDEHGRVEGNGLGLAICLGLVEQLQGRIDLESEPGVGTTATVRFPLEPQRVPLVSVSSGRPAAGRLA
jgi:signal transduction histidine kinase